MSQWKKFLYSTYKNVILKRKFKSFFALFFDREYRDDINFISLITKNKINIKKSFIPLTRIRYGHKVHYPLYALSLAISNEPFPSLRVVEYNSFYYVVDGNHRLFATQFNHKLYSNPIVEVWEMV